MDIKMDLPSGNLTQHSELENHHAIHGKTHELSTGPFSIAMVDYQRVTWKVEHHFFSEPATTSTGRFDHDRLGN